MKHNNLNMAIMGTAAILSLGFHFTGNAAPANGWSQQNGIWNYYENGSLVRNDWKKTNNHWFYLNSNGEMVKNAKIDDKYVNGDGAMVSNEWREIYEDGEENWYYFTQTGTMASDGWKTINNKKYHFDSDGSMDHGWFDDGQYYLGGPDDGAMKTGWAYMEGPTDSEYENEENSYYFGSNGILTKDKIGRKINGYTYAFDENGRMMYGWVDTVNKKMAWEDGASSDIADYQFFKEEQLKNGIDGSRMTGWKRMDPPDHVDSDSDDTPWYYFKDGVPYAASGSSELTIKSINSKKYGFNQSGEMLYGLQTVSSDGTVATGSNAAAPEDTVYYFGNSNDGAMKTGNVTVYDEDDDEKYSYYFSSTGKGYNGIKNDCLYIKGRRMDSDRDSKYQVVSNGEITRLVNTSGKIMKSTSDKGKVYKDNNGDEFTVDRQGEITSELPNGYVVKTH